jgi:hypothetical protein
VPAASGDAGGRHHHHGDKEVSKMEDQTTLTATTHEQLAAEDLAAEIVRALIRTVEKFWNQPNPEACVAEFKSERKRLEAEWLERYQPETGSRIVRAAQGIVMRKGRAAMAKIGIDVDGPDNGRDA